MTGHDFLLDVARRFATGEIVALAPLGRGLINDTYRIDTRDGTFVLQRINARVFPEPLKILANYRALLEHTRISKRHPAALQLPELLTCNDGSDHFRDEHQAVWRAQSFIVGSRSLERLDTTQQAEQIGWALGQFHALVADLPPERMHDTLPGFHVAPAYLRQFDRALAASRPSGDGQLASAIDFVGQRRNRCNALENALTEGRLTTRVIHGDPKFDNVLFDEESGAAVSLIDLDTVKPGLIHYDIGDCLRSCCNRAGESGSAPWFDLGLCRALLGAYWDAARAELTPHDRDLIADAALLLPLELGMRFLTDHLNGDTYFKVSEPGQNLSRALTQFRLVESLEAQEADLRTVVAGLN